MAVNWEVRPHGEEAPAYLPNSELFTIRMHYMMGDIEGMAGYVDYCCADQMSRVELLSMAKEFKLQIDNCSVWWLDHRSEKKGLKEINTDLEAVKMALFADSSKEVHVYIRVDNRGNDHGCAITGNNVGDADIGQRNADLADNKGQEEEETEPVEGSVDAKGLLIGKQSEEKEMDEGSDLYDSDNSFHADVQEEAVDNADMPRSEIVVFGQPSTIIDIDSGTETEYAGSEELQSCSSTDEEELVYGRPKYAEFNEEVDMKNPTFKIGMKFKSFKQFKEAVKNYGIKNRYVMNFKPNNRTRCKAICKKGCPFYLWASPMVRDRSTIQIKSGILKHECARDHTNRHVSAEWIAKTYLERFRADPLWKTDAIIQAVKINQEVDISRLKAYRAKCIAQRYLWPKSEEGPMISPEPLNSRRGRKTLQSRREVGEENIGFTGGKVSKKGVVMTCSICGVAGHNRRYHGVQGSTESANGQPTEIGDDNPMDDMIDIPVLEGHFKMVDFLRGYNQTEGDTSERQISKNPISQEIARPGETIPGAPPAVEPRFGKPKLQSIGRKTTSTQEAEPSNSTRVPVLNPGGKAKNVEESKEEGATKRRKSMGSTRT